MRKLRYYNIKSLTEVVFYRIFRDLTLHQEKGKKQLYTDLPLKKSLTNTHAITNILQHFPLHISDHTKEANDIIQGNINIFDHCYSFSNYLQDPISKKIWPSNVFFADAKTTLHGYGDVKYVLELNKLNHLVLLSTTYYQTKKVKYIHYIEKQINQWIKEVLYERSVANKITMDIAFRSINLIFISLYCSENKYFQTKVYPLIHNILILSERQMRKFSTPRWFKTGNGANHTIGEMVGLIITQRWLGFINNEEPNQKYIQQEYAWLYETLSKLIPSSGVYLENSANYTRLVSEFLVCLNMFEQAFGKENLYIEEKYLMPILNYLNSLSYCGELPNFGDNDAATVLIPFKINFADIKPLHAYLETLTRIIQDDSQLEKYSKDGHFIWKSNSLLNLYIFIRFGNWSIFRPGAASHLHCDLLSVNLYAKGHPLFIDKGCYFYNQSFDIRRKCLSTVSHNTISISDLEQADYNNGWFNYPKSKALEKDADDCIFIGCVEYKGVVHTRQLNHNSNTIIVTDKIEKENDKKVTLNYILHESIVPNIIDTNTVILFTPLKDKIKIVFEGVEIGIYEDEYFPHYATKRATHSLRGNIINNVVITKIIFEE
ncbi:heparinase II/III family protein [Bacteroides sp.]|uniref:heparinase II/III domain-containing protein n=1 Tax=Bacteroides sp. TaxID=29523 RepID=UPI002FCC9860